MNGCNDCRNYVPGESHRSCLISKKPKVEATCLLENNTAMQKWWRDNGKKIPGKDKLDDMPCFEERESALMLQRMDNLLDKIDEKISKSQQAKDENG